MKKSFITAVLIVTALIAAFTSPAFCWWDQGHEIVASIAWDNMEQSTKDRLSAIGFNQTRFINAACYPDDFKNETTAPWHYVNWIYAPDGMHRTVLAGGILEAIPQEIRNLISDPKDFTSVKYLAHFIGDIHCPMHNISYMINGEPDLGGNKFYITLPDGNSVKLHAFWDSLPTNIMKKHCDKVGVKYLINRPMSLEKFEKKLAESGYQFTEKKYEDYLYDQRQGEFEGIISTGRMLVSKEGIKKDRVNIASPDTMVTKWSYDESYKIACSSYHQDMDIDKPFMNSSDTISPEYEKKAIKEARQRLVLAGMRLASILDAIYNN
ncbi:MAG: S1/P1 nuclease [Firmicutes bacterium]|nr:S1/P1 nuclease [Bacillota bacterium]